jgi:hypothetical protein
VGAVETRCDREYQALDRFEPDATTLELLGAEHQNGVWVGRELLPVANRIRSSGGSEDDYIRWVMASHLWTSYVYSTNDSARDHRRHLNSAWDKAERSRPFDLEDCLADLADRIAMSRWVGRSGSRNRMVAMAFVGFCIEHNCYTRTISCYELSKYTPGLSPNVVNKALRDLIGLGLLMRVERRDRRTSSRSTSRYQVNLYWRPETPKGLQRSTSSAPRTPSGYSVPEIRNTCKSSLSPLRDEDGYDVWSSRGLGLTAGRVYAVLADEPATVREISERAGVSDGQARRAVAKLADHALAGTLPGRPARYFKVETPLPAVEDLIGCSGYVEFVISRTEAWQEANRIGYSSAYQRSATA